MHTTDDLSTTAVEELSWRVAADGVGAHMRAISRLLTRARALHVAPGASAALADPASPEVARQRAFAHVAREVAAASAHTTRYTRVA